MQTLLLCKRNLHAPRKAAGPADSSCGVGAGVGAGVVQMLLTS
jgi:hypothetical protein